MTDDDKFRRIDDELKNIGTRLDRHDRRIQSVETARAVADKSQEHIDAKFAALHEEVRSIKRPVNTVIIAMILALVGAFMTFVLQGGLVNAAG